MNILYAAYRHDPTDPDLSSGADYQFYRAISEQGNNIIVLGPFHDQPFVLEDLFRQIYRSVTSRRYAKFPLSLAWYVSKKVNLAVDQLRPDLVFSMFPPPLTFYSGKVPCIYRQDTSFFGWQAQYPEFGHIGYEISLWSEKKVFSSASRVITHSSWNRNILINEYGLNSKKIVELPNPAALPNSVIPSQIDIYHDKQVTYPIRLLFVGRDPIRKGENIALEIVNLLNNQDLPAHLTICGLPEKRKFPYTTYVGSFKKSIPEELHRYVELFHNAHLLVHPARFDPSPIVTAEAAAFGTPTITNNVGGMATSVKDGISGVVLPRNSPAKLYAQSIIELFNNPQRYYELCHTTRQRYVRELNWNVAGKKLMETITEVVLEKERAQ